MFCVKCGAETKKGKFFCEKHAEKNVKIKNIAVNVCKLCGGDEKKAVIKSLKIKNPEFIRKILNTYEIEISAGNKKFIYIAKITRKKCANCIKILGNYHEAVIQIRGERVNEFYNNIIKNLSNGEITSTERKKEGIDIKLVNKGTAKKIARRIKNLSIAVKQSFRFVTSKKGKKLYRVYYSIRT
ncbi:MAG: hypothetical protein J4473_01335 [Candidatus Aenigmarchaeota archaeon]|nr:hypothetical protein [Candidatus Aenigmarchaeota archaeon]